MTVKFSRRGAMLLPLAAALPHRARATGITLTDAIGRTLTLPAAAERIVLGFNLEEFTAVAGAGGWRRVVGFNRRQWEVNRPSLWARMSRAIPGLTSIADIGEIGEGTLKVETVLAQRPDLMVVIAHDYRASAAQIGRIEAAGIPVLVLDFQAQDPAKHIAGTLALGAVTGEPDRARALADLYRDRTDEIARRTAGRPRPRAYFELGAGGPGVIGNSYNGAMWGRMVQTSGGANIAEGRLPGPWAPMAAEAVLAAQPEFVFLAGSSWARATGAIRTGYDADLETARARLRGYLARPGWADLPAVRRNEVHALDAGLARSLWDFTAMQYIAGRLHPDAFTDIDPQAELRRFHERFLPIPFEGQWMVRSAPAGA
jgi:iron complex transport system substrate-binding protein